MNQVFVDMAVENLEMSMVFYTQIGFQVVQYSPMSSKMCGLD